MERQITPAKLTYLLAILVAAFLCADYFGVIGKRSKVPLDDIDNPEIPLPMVPPALTVAPPVSVVESATDKCDATELVRTLSTRWVQPGERTLKQYFEFSNSTGETVFLRLLDAGTANLLETVLVLPGEKIVEPVLGISSKMSISTGSSWCNRFKGWSNSAITDVLGAINGTVGVTKVKITRSLENARFSVVIVPPPVRATDQRISEFGGPGPYIPTRNRPDSFQPNFGSTGRSNPVVPVPAAAIGRLQQKYEQPRQVPIPSQQQPATDQMPQNVRIQDYRDVPQRDLRLVTSGTRHYLGGKVGEEDTQFEVSLYGYTAISEAMARSVGASGCIHGNWLVLGRYWSTCQKLIPSLWFGSVELENVLVAVLPGNQRPIIGPDLLGQAHIFHGHDGDYISVGR